MTLYDTLTGSMHLGERARCPQQRHVAVSRSLTTTVWCSLYVSSVINWIYNDPRDRPNRTNYGLRLRYSNVLMLRAPLSPKSLKLWTPHVVIIWSHHLYCVGSIRSGLLYHALTENDVRVLHLTTFTNTLIPMMCDDLNDHPHCRRQLIVRENILGPNARTLVRTKSGLSWDAITK